MAGKSLKILQVLAVAFMLAASGCTAMLEGESRIRTAHYIPPYEAPPEQQIEISSYDELTAEILSLIMQHESTGSMYAVSYDGDVEQDVRRVCLEMRDDDPLVAYAVESMDGETKRIVSSYEIAISIEYRRTKQQVDSIVNVSTLRFLPTEILSVMSAYQEETVLRTSLRVTEEELTRYIKDEYYKNPRRIVMLPVVDIETYLSSGDDKIFELRFGNTVQTGILRQYSVSLADLYVRSNALLAVGETDAEILLSLAENLIASTEYDEAAARTIGLHGAQNFAATAYGALANGKAVGEGFAMAYKALCDELGLDCRVVLGYNDGRVHAWNIVWLSGYYYHIDVAMCAANGIQTAFLKTDEDFYDSYSWNTEATVECEGTLTYFDIVGHEDEEEEEEGMDASYATDGDEFPG